MPVALELVAPVLVAPVLVAPVHAAPVVGLVEMAPAALSLAAAALCRGARAPTALNCVRPSPCTFMRHAAANRTSHQICRHPSTCCLNAPRAAASLAPLKSHFFLHHSTLPSEMLHFLQAINERLPVIGLRTSGQSTATISPMEPSLLAPSSARPAQRAPTPSKRSCAPVPLAATLVPPICSQTSKCSSASASSPQTPPCRSRRRPREGSAPLAVEPPWCISRSHAAPLLSAPAAPMPPSLPEMPPPPPPPPQLPAMPCVRLLPIPNQPPRTPRRHCAFASDRSTNPI